MAKHYINENIIKALKKERLRQKMTQAELSKLTGISQPQLARIESNTVDIRLSTIMTLARALRMELTLVPLSAYPAVKAVLQHTSDEEAGRPSKQRSAVSYLLDDDDDDDDDQA